MKNKTSIKKFLIRNNTYLIFLGLIIACSLVSDRFLAVMNLRNIALQQAGPMCVVLGMLFVILTGGIDLSVGSMMALGSSCTAYMIVNAGFHFVPAMLISLVVGVICGAFTGFLVAYCNFQGFVASLAMMTIARSASLVITNGSPIRLETDTLATLVKGTVRLSDPDYHGTADHLPVPGAEIHRLRTYCHCSRLQRRGSRDGRYPRKEISGVRVCHLRHTCSAWWYFHRSPCLNRKRNNR